MNFCAPAKTFFIGEYVATAGGPAIVLATGPFFSIRFDQSESGLVNIHPQSPAGRWYKRQSTKPSGLIFTDPYCGKGGLGASSAQFVLVYKAVGYCQQQKSNDKSLLTDYYQYVWQGKGLRPSGYDVLTQFSKRSLFIDSYGKEKFSLNWPFPEINLLLIHTGYKLPTHVHLANQKQPNINELQPTVYNALASWKSSDVGGIIRAINTYYQQLRKLHLVCSGTVKLVSKFMSMKEGVLAAKGCGAMGADVVLLIVENNHSNSIQDIIKKLGFAVLAEITNSGSMALP